MLSDAGGAIVVLEVQGSLFFGSTERLLRRVAQVADAARYVILDFRRANFADASARKPRPPLPDRGTEALLLLWHLAEGNLQDRGQARSE